MRKRESRRTRRRKRRRKRKRKRKRKRNNNMVNTNNIMGLTKKSNTTIKKHNHTANNTTSN
eukprot:9427423-Pyramimonas_sp.AAC.1